MALTRMDGFLPSGLSQWSRQIISAALAVGFLATLGLPALASALVAPANVKSVSGFAYGDYQVRLIWEIDPPAADAPVTGYKLQYRDHTERSWSETSV